LLDSANRIELPFNFEVVYNGKQPSLIIRNADERIVVDEISLTVDSFNFKMPVFDSEFRCRRSKNGFTGVWINHYRSNRNRIPFVAEFGRYNRFETVPGKANPVFEGRWKVVFSPGSKDSTAAVGIFNHIEQTDFLKGTFLTETGDYRYLEGIRSGSQIFLSSFDGSRAYLFTGNLKDGMIEGMFYSGMHWREPWIAKRDESFKLRDAEEITSLKNGSGRVAFSFPDLDGKTISLDDDKFKNKPVIVQLMGSWCANCLDESRYFTELYHQYHASGLEIIALAFEKTTEEQKARQLVKRFKDRVHAPYEFLITSQSGKASAEKFFPQLSAVSAFPTTIFLNKAHEVVKIHTGFNGPATGEEYQVFKERTENLISTLMKE
jgi:thiol-disulfide isomerase/thioredoxin